MKMEQRQSPQQSDIPMCYHESMPEDGLKTAKNPEEIASLLLARLNAGDPEGCAMLYEDEAVLSTGDNQVAVGRKGINQFYVALLADRPFFQSGESRKPLVNGDLALTSNRLENGDITVEIARRQTDGSWLYVVDQPRVS